MPMMCVFQDHERAVLLVDQNEDDEGDDEGDDHRRVEDEKVAQERGVGQTVDLLAGVVAAGDRTIDGDVAGVYVCVAERKAMIQRS